MWQLYSKVLIHLHQQDLSIPARLSCVSYTYALKCCTQVSIQKIGLKGGQQKCKWSLFKTNKNKKSEEIRHNSSLLTFNEETEIPLIDCQSMT